MKRVLLVEPNPYHGVILPGFAHYFQQIGFNVDLLVRSECKYENPFSKFSKPELPLIQFLTSSEMKLFLKSDKIAPYDCIFFCSNVWWEPGVFVDSYIRALNAVPRPKICSLFVEHNLSHLNRDDSRIFYSTKRIVTLSTFPHQGKNTMMVCPCYFGKTAIKHKSDIAHFLVIGSLSKSNKNFSLLLSSLSELIKLNKRFKVTVVGENNYNLPIERECKKYIQFTGKIDFPHMYDILEKADFILPLLDSQLDEHDKYYSGTTTGSLLLSYGFNKIMLIDGHFTNSYGLNSKNSIRYNPSSFTSALVKAIDMSINDYESMQFQLKKRIQAVKKISVNNLIQIMRLNESKSQITLQLEDNVQLALSRYRGFIDLIKLKIAILIKKVYLRYVTFKER